MKKLSLVLIVTLISAASLFAQGSFRFGPKVGINLANISNSDNVSNDSDGKYKMGIHLGAVGEMQITDLLGFQVELLYSGQGFRFKALNGKVQARVNYLNVPVLVKFRVWEGLSLEAGPQFGIACNAKTRLKSGDTVIKTKFNDDLNRFDLSLSLGMSYELFTGIIASARYNVGLTNVFDKDWVGSTNKNSVFQFSVAYLLDL